MQPWEESHHAGYRAQLRGEFSEARRYYEQALTANPEYAFSQLALAQLLMLESGFREGRDLYEARFEAREEKDGYDWRALPTPRWRGEALGGKHLHLWAEQGFGDVVMYAAFLPYLLEQRPAKITLAMFPKLMPLFARSFPEVAVESLEDVVTQSLSPVVLQNFPQLLALMEKTGLHMDLGPMQQEYERALVRGVFDYTAPMGDLMVYGLADHIPATHKKPYLIADSALVAATKTNLNALGPGRRVGISWYTSNMQSGSVRNIPLELWLPLLATPSCHFISLQHHVLPQEISDFCAHHGCTIVADPAFNPVHDTEGLAALAACMDEVITIDNSTVHLAGALGIPTILLLPKGCDFRWPLLKGEHDALWYGSVAIKRQQVAMDWQPVMEQVTHSLRHRLKA